MSQIDRSLKNKFRKSEPDPLGDFLDRAEKRTAPSQAEPEPKPTNKFWIVALIVLFGFFTLRAAGNFSFNPLNLITQSVLVDQQPSEDLLNRMNARMVEMGYTGLSHDQLRELRSNGVTATYTSNVRALGFTDITLDQVVSLARADASSSFMAMMIELGYEPNINDFINLRRAGVTAFFTSRVHDLGYRDVSVDQLIRMRQIGVTTSLIEQLQQERGEDLPLEEIIRYRISNQ